MCVCVCVFEWVWVDQSFPYRLGFIVDIHSVERERKRDCGAKFERRRRQRRMLWNYQNLPEVKWHTGNNDIYIYVSTKGCQTAKSFTSQVISTDLLGY